jgi:mRNA interferase MazF
MSNAIPYGRADVVLVPFPFVTNFTKAKARPAIVIQNDIANKYSPNLILALISSAIPKKSYPFHYRIRGGSKMATQSGLDRDSIVKTEVIVTIPKASILKKIGSLPPEAMFEVNECLKISLGL